MFAAGHIKALSPHARVVVLEATSRLLKKVSISGGGRCNVTHMAMPSRQLVENYPRGSKELLSSFTAFGTVESAAWFEARCAGGLKTEADGRVFPTSDSSQTIVNALLDAASGVDVRTRSNVVAASWDAHELCFRCDIDAAGSRDGRQRSKTRQTLCARKFVMASGSVQKTLASVSAGSFGLSLVPPVPSLFSFTTPDDRLRGLEGVSVPAATVSMPGLKAQTGPLLVTHGGISGPAVLRLSAFGARKLAESKWQADLTIDWTGSQHSQEEVYGMLLAAKGTYGKRMVRGGPPTELRSFFTKRLWARICLLGALPQEDLTWANLSKAAMRQLAADVTSFSYNAGGKSTNKEEFVTAGGVALENLRMPSMESRRFPGLYSIGEMNDVDGVTGGFNFTSCWSQAWHAGNHIAEALAQEEQARAQASAG